MRMILNIWGLVFLLAAADLSGQAAMGLPKRFTNTVYDVEFLKMSSDSRWICFQKSYDDNSDTLVVVDRYKNDKEFYQKPDAIPLYTTFTSRGYLLTRGHKTTELLKLPSKDKLSWDGVADAMYDSHFNIIYLLKDNDLLIINGEGNLINKVQHVREIYKVNDDKFLSIIDKNGECIAKLDGAGFTKMYTSRNMVKFILQSNKSQTLLLEKNLVEKKNHILFINNSDETPKVFKLPDEYSENFHVTEVRFLKEMKYYIRITTNKKEKNPSADLWYSNDNALATKNYAESSDLNFIWDTGSNTVKRLQTEGGERIVFFGNSQYYIKFDPFKKDDLAATGNNYSLHLFNFWDNTVINTIESTSFVVGNSGNYLLTLQNGYWQLYDLIKNNKKQLPFKKQEYQKYNISKPFFAADGNTIIFEMKDYLYEYNITNDKLKSIPTIEGFDTEILNAKRSTFLNGFDFGNNTYDSSKPILIRLYNRNENKTSLAVFKEKLLKIMVKATRDNITSAKLSANSKAIVYVKNSMSSVPVIVFSNGEPQELYKTNKHDTNSLIGLRSVMVHYKGPCKEKLRGILIFPLNYEKGTKYPMIVSIYEKQNHLSNKYLKDGFKGPSAGFNIRDFIQRGYFVFMPDITIADIGPGKSALLCVHNSLDALQNIEEIDFKKIGLIGFSFGGYETNFIATQSDRFATFVSGAGNSDLMAAYFSYNYHFNYPMYKKFENGQYEMQKPFFSDKRLYIENSPVYYADRLRVPILLWTGNNDKNVDWKQTMSYFLSLKRSGKSAIAVFYSGEAHGLVKKTNMLDIFLRIEDWFDYFLKGKSSGWIDKLMKDAC